MDSALSRIRRRRSADKSRGDSFDADWDSKDIGHSLAPVVGGKEGIDRGVVLLKRG
jgi:hypothetical protein